jgi:hypothetical protein
MSLSLPEPNYEATKQTLKVQTLTKVQSQTLPFKVKKPKGKKTPLDLDDDILSEYSGVGVSTVKKERQGAS